MGERPVPSAALLDLKAELGKKQEALKQAKLQADGLQTFMPKLHKSKKTNLRCSSVLEVKDEELAQHEKSRVVLEAKAELYEKILSKEIAIGDSENCLVDFTHKVYPKEEKMNKGSICDLYEHQRNVEDTLRNRSIPMNKQEFFKVNEDNFGSSSFQAAPVHYQNVQFNEIRDHGVGYFSFSTNEEERIKQMKMLKEMRHLSEKKQDIHNVIRKEQETLLGNRLSKICKRRKIDEVVVESHAAKDSDKAEAATHLESIPLPEGEDSCSVLKAKKIRLWDIGKVQEGFESSTHTGIIEDWTEQQRCERNPEFAPPKCYSEKTENQQQKT